MNREELAAEREIDVSALDVEAATQADRFYAAAERAIEAKHAAKELELAADVLEAKLQIKCRDFPGEFGLTAVTEAAVKAAVKSSPQYVAAVRAFMEAEKTAALLDAHRSAMADRKRMIETLVTLHGQQYFAGPSVPRDLMAAYVAYRGTRANGTLDKMRAAARKRQK